MIFKTPLLLRKGLANKEAGMEDYCMKEFVAFSKKLLRDLVKIRKLLDNGGIDEAKELLDELIEDTRSDIEA